MLTWTPSGAVESPSMVQVRVQRSYPGRVRAGAPVPTRSMTTQEIRDNLHYFAVTLDGPRTRACTRLVLSGVGVAARPDTPELLAQARDWGIGHVVLHLGRDDLDIVDPAVFAGKVDALVVPVQPGPTGGAVADATRVIQACQAAGIQVVANTVLSPLALKDLLPAARAVVASGAQRVSLSYPFPIAGNVAGNVAPIAATLQALGAAVGLLERSGVQVSIKGLPGCYLGDLARLIHRSANRWYVDADHQLDRAVLFFPGVVSFTKREVCRFCALDGQCDGFFATYLRRPGYPALKAVEPSPTS